MNDLSGQEDTFKAHKAARGLATSRICACMTAPRAALSTELNMARLVASNLRRGKERLGPSHLVYA